MRLYHLLECIVGAREWYKIIYTKYLTCLHNKAAPFVALACFINYNDYDDNNDDAAVMLKNEELVCMWLCEWKWEGGSTTIYFCCKKTTRCGVGSFSPAYRHTLATFSLEVIKKSTQQRVLVLYS